MKILKFILWISLIIVFSTCVTTNGNNSAASLVPADAICYIQAGSIVKLLDNVDEFMAAANLTEQLGNLDAKAMLNLVLAMGMQGMDLNWINMEKPVAIALLPPQPQTDKWDNVMVTIPLSAEGLKNYDNFIKLIGEKMEWSGEKVKDYLVLCSQPWISDQVPPAKRINVGKMAAYEPGSLSLYISINNLLKATGKTWEELEKELISPLLSESTTMTGQEIGQMESLLALYMDFIKDVQDLTFNLAINKNGLVSRVDITCMKNGKIHEFSKKIPGNKNIKTLLKYLPQNSLFTFASNIPLTAFEKMYMDMYKAIGIDDALLTELLNSTKTMYNYIGPGMAMSYDFDMDFNAIMQLEDMDFESLNKINFDEILSIDMIAAMDIKNRDKIREFYKNFKFDELYNKLIANMLKNQLGNNFNMKLDMKTKQDLDDAGFKYDTFTFGLKFDIPQDGVDNQEKLAIAQVFLNQIMEKLTLYMHYKTDKAYMVLGHEGLETLKEITAQDGFKAGESLSGSPAAKRMLSLMPDNSDIVYQFSLVRLFNFLAAIPDLKITPLKLDDAPGFLGSVDFDKNNISTLIAWDSGEIGAIVMQLLPLITSLSESDNTYNFDEDYEGGEYEDEYSDDYGSEYDEESDDSDSESGI